MGPREEIVGMAPGADNEVPVIDVVDGRLWRLEHRDWRPGLDRHRVARRAGAQPRRVRAGARAPAVARRRRVDGLR
jgi:hypothetical protein